MSNEVSVRTTGLIPRSIADVMQVAKALAGSSMVPSCYQGEPGNIVAAIQLGGEIGIPPMTMLQNSYPVANKIGLYTDLLMAIVKSQPSYAGQKIHEATENVYDISLFKTLPNGKLDEYRSRFTIQMADRAGLTGKRGSAWETYRERMLKHRACAFAARDGWPEKLAGIYTVEELMSLDNADGDLRFVTDNPAEATMDNLEQDSVTFEDDPELEALVKMAKDINCAPKEIAEIRQRYKAMKGNARGIKAVVKAVTDELVNRSNRRQRVIVEQGEATTDQTGAIGENE